jgi:hypothetical protein
MIWHQATKVMHSIPTTSCATNNTSALLTVDTLGYDYCTIDVGHTTAATNASTKWTALTVYEHDTTTFATTYTVVAGTTNTTASTGQFIINGFNGDTASTQTRITRIGIACNNARRRYLSVVPAPGSTTYSACFAMATLSRAKLAPDTTTEAYVNEYTFV